MSDKLILISSLDALKKTDTFDSHWPLHATVMPWFSIPESRRTAFDNALKNRMHEFSRIHATGDQEAYFGPDKTIRVRTLRDIGGLAALHSKLLETVDTYGGTLYSAYIGDAYRPHVTFQGNRGIDKDERITFDSVHLIVGDIGEPQYIAGEYRFVKDQPKRA